MERLRLDLEQLNKALKTVEDSFRVIQDAEKTGNIEFVLAAEDSTVQRFEYTYETFWKFLKKYMELTYGLQDLKSPRQVFRASVGVEICTLDEASTFLDMADGRNETSHTYNIESSRAVLADIPGYCETMMGVVKRFNQSKIIQV